MTSRTIVRLDAEKRAARGDRWQRIAKSAAEQAKRSSVPQVSAPVSIAEALIQLADYDRIVVLWEDSRGTGLADALADLRGRSDARIALVIGPEGGLSAEDVDALVACGAVVASLGPTVLRTETAAVVALALALGALGGMGGSK
jgi:16S rRNA (uracil1498-N3)-methyltransferase